MCVVLLLCCTVEGSKGSSLLAISALKGMCALCYWLIQNQDSVHACTVIFNFLKIKGMLIASARKCFQNV